MLGMGGEEVSYRFKCPKCTQWHDELPDIGYDRPLYAAEIPREEQDGRVFLNSDLCVVDNEHYFIRCILLVPVIGLDQEFGWGIWSTLSKSNFERYRQHFDDDLSNWPAMFGYLSNRLPEYPDTLNLKLSVQTKKRGERPHVILEPTEHPLAVDQRCGMPLERALVIAGPFLH